jgi:hypothetical protein
MRQPILDPGAIMKTPMTNFPAPAFRHTSLSWSFRAGREVERG